jgi:hypothetical protein
MAGWAIVPRGEYPPDWPAIALAVKDAAAWRCVRCEAPHSRDGWRILTIHHLNGDKSDCRWWNLMTKHTLWFRPYVAAFYAQKYLGEDLTRAEVEARLDELLRVEYRMVLGLGAA